MRPATIGRGLLDDLPSLLAPAVRSVVVVSTTEPPAVSAIAARVAAVLERSGRTVHRLDVPVGEAAKTYAVLERGWDALGAAGVSRSDAIVGVGGGAVTDVAGFLAATWLRGLDVAHVPTTVLGMVDAAIGGKTAINTPVGKNLVGAVHAPVGVLCDLDLLALLPPAEVRSGLAEVVKCGFVGDPAILDLVEADPPAALDTTSSVLAELVERAVRYKERVVAGDPFDDGADATDGPGRLVLNYGHTLAHAIEHVEGYRIRHGEAVSMGLVYAAALAELAGRLDAGIAARHSSILSSLGLPTAYRAEAWPALHAAMRSDKKSRGGNLRFVVLDGLARPGLLTAPTASLLTAAYATTIRRNACDQQRQQGKTT